MVLNDNGVVIPEIAYVLQSKQFPYFFVAVGIVFINVHGDIVLVFRFIKHFLSHQCQFEMKRKEKKTRPEQGKTRKTVKRFIFVTLFMLFL